ncbi:MAG: leucine-rich repeat domain-containing protein, partial [Acidobacteria bacterium]|nr:leucine-rich repeat domain-containing protein [Acidobacteriota bacterium]
MTNFHNPDNNSPSEALREANARIQQALKEQATTLDLGNLGLTELPESLGQLTQLHILHIYYNELTSLPESLGQLTQLRALTLFVNQLTSLPESLGQLKELLTLYIDRNQLTSLPESLGQLTKLSSLEASNNRLTSLPEGLRNLKSLEELYLHGNEQLGLPAEVLGPTYSDVYDKHTQPANPADILDYYFRVRGDEGKRPLNEAKLILVGRGAVGKTSLVNRLVHESFKPDEKKTEGICITDWSLVLNGNENVRLNVWDFGGQEIMHATHQFFLTQRSIYLLVLNGREGFEDADAEYWLKLIESFGGGSPVIVVLNKIKEHAFDVNRRALEQKYPVRDFIKTDCADGIGIDELRKAIERETDRLEHLRDAFPASWFSIKEQLAQ